jgi:hypothetical protein
VSSSRRRWFRFSLRTFLIAVTLFSLAFGYFFNGVQNERRAAKAVAEAHGDIVYDWQIRAPGSDPKIQPKPPGPAWLRERVGAHWFDRIVEVGLNGYINKSGKNRFAVVGPHLVKLPPLRSLSLWGGELSADDYRLLGELKQLESLRLRQESEIRPQHAAAIARLTSLRELDLSEVRIAPEALRELSKLPQLEALKISCFFHDPNASGIQRKYQLRDDGAEALASFPKLKSLMLFATLITDEGMAALSRLSRLETLVVSSPHITSKSFDHVTRLKHLEHLGTWQWKIDDADIEKLSQLPNLTSLGLVTKLSDTSVSQVTALSQIERLTICGEEITDASVPHLVRLSKLEWLDLSDTSIDKLGPAAKELRRAFPTCMINLPKTEKEKEMERAFRNWKWGGGSL